MLSGLDHLIIACGDPEASAAEIESALGLHTSGGGRHDAHGTFNRLIWLGDSYIELMGLFNSSLAEQSWWGGQIARLLATAPAGYAGLALASDDLRVDSARLLAQGSPISDPIEGERRRPDGEVVRWQIGRLPEPDPELGLLFLIEHDTAAAEWRPADRAPRRAAVHPVGTPGRLVRVELPVADAAATTMHLLRAFGLQFRPSLAGRGARDSSIGTQTLRLSPAEPGARAQVTIRAGHERREVDLLGVRWLVEPV